jgi:CheY-specific phosphatase CheX
MQEIAWSPEVIDDMKVSLVKALEQVFTTMFNSAITVLPVVDLPDPKHLSALVGFGGRLSGFLCLHFSGEAACSIASGLLGMPMNELDDTVFDAAGETVNMLAGCFKNQVSKTEEMFKISVPSVIQGREYNVHTRANSHQVLFGVSTGSYEFVAQLVLEQKQ